MMVVSRPSVRAQITAPVRVLELPRAFAPQPANNPVADATGKFFLVGSAETDTVFAFDATSGTVAGSVVVGDGPSRLAVQGNVAAVLNTAFIGAPTPSVTILDVSDPRAMRVTATCRLPERRSAALSPETLTLSRDGRFGFVCVTDRRGRGTLCAFETATGRLVGQLDEIGSFPVQAGLQERNGRRLLALVFAPDGQGGVVFFDVSAPATPRRLGALTLAADARFSANSTVALSDDDEFGYIAVQSRREVLAFSTTRFETLNRLATVGRSPTRLLRRGNRLLVQEELTASVSIVDLTQPDTPRPRGQFVSSTATLTGSLGISPDGRTAFVVSPFESLLFAFDVESGAQRGRIPIPADGLPQDLAVAASLSDVRCAVLLPDDRRIALFRPAVPSGFAPTGTFSTPDGVAFSFKQRLQLSADGSRLFAPSALTDEILEISTETATVVNRIKSEFFPGNLTLYEGDTVRRLASVNLGSATVALFVSEKNGPWRRTGVVELPVESATLLDFAAVVFSRDGRTGYVGDLASDIVAFDTDSGKVLGQVTVGPNPPGLGYLEYPSGERMIAVNTGRLQEENNLVVVEASNPAAMRIVTKTPIDKDTLVALDNIPTFTPDGRSVFLSASFAGELLAIDPSRGRIVSRTAGVTGVTLLPFTKPDGKPDFVTANLLDGKIIFLTDDAAGGLRKRLRVEPPEGNVFLVSNRPVVFPDGRRGVIPSYSLRELLVFSTERRELTGRIPLPGAPGEVVLSRNLACTVEINGQANRLFFVDLKALPTAVEPDEQ